MRTILKELQDNIMTKDRDESRALVEALRNPHTVSGDRQPAISTIVLLQKVAEELDSWLMVRDYAIAGKDVNHDSILC